MEYKDYIEPLTRADKLRVKFIQDRGRIIQFIVQYYAVVGPGWRTIMRIDNCHGSPHQHVYHLRSGEYRVKLHQDPSEAFTDSKLYPKKNHEAIKENFLLS